MPRNHHRTPPRYTKTYHNNNGPPHLHQNQQQHPKGKYNRTADDNASQENHVLLMTVMNALYNVNCDLLQQVCGAYGKVNRIVIFRKNGVQAMVEFDDLDSAKRVKASLNGCDIYSGCCTLRIEYAKPTRLNVRKNDNDSFDYTNTNMPNVIEHSHVHGGTNAVNGCVPVDMNDHRQSSFEGLQNNSQPGPMLQPQQPQHQGAVMMVYGLQPERLNCDRLFNLFCLYGNVVRVKFLRTKEGCAMVQMGDAPSVDRCVSSLNRITLFGSDLQISYSKQPFLHDVVQPFVLSDGSPSFKDFTNNKNNRFNNPEVASKNRILPPSQILHFFNAPHGISEDELMHLFKHNAGYEPVSVKIFTPKSENSKSFSGLAVFRDATEASETLVQCNHIGVPKPGVPHPYILRLCFSPPNFSKSSPHVSQSNQQQQQSQQPAS